MSNCSNCQKKFAIFKVNRTKCMECGQGYCHQCIRRGNGYRFYCDVCHILNTRPVNRSRLMDLRSKEVKLYLARRKVSTERCLEKEDLVNRFLWYVDLEPRLPKNGNKKNYLNGLVSQLTSSMPNLFEPSVVARQESSRNAHEEPSSSRVPNNRRMTFTEPQQFNIPGNNASSRATSSSNEVPPQGTNSNTSSNTTTASSEPVKKLIRLSDIRRAEEIPNLTVKQLKELLFINRVDFKGCVEKEELTNKAIHLWMESHTEDPENLASEDLCKICMDAPLNSVLLECGHIATCIDCGKQLAECPICRQYIVRVVHTFKA